jgi:hypothetical protein
MIIGIAGTAKNTGKTTALGALIREATSRGLRVAVTGIGYDGEERDTITGLPKPRLDLPAGTIATTSEACLRVSAATVELLRRTGYQTPLGEVLVLRVVHGGPLVIAGPSTAAALREVCAIMAGEGAGPIFVDGSLNRIAPMVVADRIVLATGAARTTDITTLAEETGSLEEIFSLPRSSAAAEERVPTVDVGSLFDAEDAAALLARARGMTARVTGLVSLEALQRLAQDTGDDVIGRLEFPDPLRLLLAGDAIRTADSLAAVRKRGTMISVAVRPALVSVTVNPYFPSYSGSTYSAAYLPAGDLLRALRQRLRTPVTDVLAEGAAGLLDRLFSLNLP